MPWWLLVLILLGLHGGVFGRSALFYEYCCCGAGFTWNGVECIPCTTRSAVTHRAGEPCADHCATGECSFCGPGGRCCADAVTSELAGSAPADLSGAVVVTDSGCPPGGNVSKRTCLAPAPAAVQHEGVECFMQCKRRSGSCDFCGGGRCCRRGWKDQGDLDGLDGCHDDEGGFDRHVCIQPVAAERSCDAPEVVLGSTDWLWCGGGTITVRCNMRDNREGCCCQDGWELADSLEKNQGPCRLCPGGSCQLNNPFIEASALDLQCHPSQHTYPCDRFPSGNASTRLRALVAAVTVLGIISSCGVFVSRTFPKYWAQLSLRQSCLRIGDRVVCTASAAGRFARGDCGVVEWVNGCQAMVRFDHGDPDAAATPVASLSLELVDRWAQLNPPPGGNRSREIDDLISKLFRMHDLNGNGLLEELELVKLNQKISMLHYGKDIDKEAVKVKYQELFRAKLDPTGTGQAVEYPRFRQYILRVLDDIDRHEPAQRMILEQFIAEAKTAREAFYWNSMASESDAPFMPTDRKSVV